MVISESPGVFTNESETPDRELALGNGVAPGPGKTFLNVNEWQIWAVRGVWGP